ncbi:uncharacterized protein F4807DRAFT_37672 [Annulohypoxylon truncatum]|uniref:uncharacterized protein n=1 Tax=Annulohypoxylon truncatum TaxID=327061 RepID=UPI002007FCE8|nr:uncharacterized protein F4807DRAFT_37672 [Annulohypoxylon truncatum]KAI1211408.1 hypothetical protein F4807DRAFT_37672 [Annulohypoxylon truncatum]
MWDLQSLDDSISVISESTLSPRDAWPCLDNPSGFMGYRTDRQTTGAFAAQDIAFNIERIGSITYNHYECGPCGKCGCMTGCKCGSKPCTTYKYVPCGTCSCIPCKCMPTSAPCAPCAPPPRCTGVPGPCAVATPYPQPAPTWTCPPPVWTYPVCPQPAPVLAYPTCPPAPVSAYPTCPPAQVTCMTCSCAPCRCGGGMPQPPHGPHPRCRGPEATVPKPCHGVQAPIVCRSKAPLATMAMPRPEEYPLGGAKSKLAKEAIPLKWSEDRLPIEHKTKAAQPATERPLPEDPFQGKLVSKTLDATMGMPWPSDMLPGSRKRKAAEIELELSQPPPLKLLAKPLEKTPHDEEERSPVPPPKKVKVADGGSGWAALDLPPPTNFLLGGKGAGKDRAASASAPELFATTTSAEEVRASPAAAPIPDPFYMAAPTVPRSVPPPAAPRPSLIANAELHVQKTVAPPAPTLTMDLPGHEAPRKSPPKRTYKTMTLDANLGTDIGYGG